MRFVHRWVSRVYWVCNFCNVRLEGGWYRKMRFVHNAKPIDIEWVKKKFFIFWSVDYVSTVG